MSDEPYNSSLAIMKGPVAVLGGKDDNQGGVAVLGSIRVERVGCE